MSNTNKQTTDHINGVMVSSVADKAVVPEVDIAEEKLKVNGFNAYIESDSFIGNPYSLLGRVIEVRKNNGHIPSDLNDPNSTPEFSLFPIPGISIDESSKIKKPIRRSSIIVNKTLSSEVSFLKYLSAELNDKTSFSIMVFDQAMGLVDVGLSSWAEGVEKWKSQNQGLMDNPDVCYIYAVIGFVQKNIIRKKYEEFSVGAKGGAYGVNVNGKLHTSTEDFSLDIRFGLTPVVIKRPSDIVEKSFYLADNPSDEERMLFGTISKIQEPASLL